jgi:hypothetical protein
MTPVLSENPIAFSRGDLAFTRGDLGPPIGASLPARIKKGGCAAGLRSSCAKEGTAVPGLKTEVLLQLVTELRCDGGRTPEPISKAELNQLPATHLLSA